MLGKLEGKRGWPAGRWMDYTIGKLERIGWGQIVTGKNLCGC